MVFLCMKMGDCNVLAHITTNYPCQIIHGSSIAHPAVDSWEIILKKTMFNQIKIKNATLVNADSRVFIKTLPDNSVDLILTDPPYFRVKSEQWDRQWDSTAEYLAWLDDFFAEFWRVLKPNGSIYLFCSSKLAADIEISMRQRFNILNNIIWAKPSGRWLKLNKQSLRLYCTSKEQIIFAEHYGLEETSIGGIGVGAKCSELKSQVFAPLIEYFKQARESLAVSAQDINRVTGTQMCSHWFSYSQWRLPNEQQYLALQQLFNERAAELQMPHSELITEYSTLKKSYDSLLLEFNDLKKKYEYMRRPFSVSPDVPYTDVWTYKPVQYYPGKHPCEKPAEMIRDILNASTRPGCVVADFFMGSGVVIKESLKLGLTSIGVELEQERFNQTVNEIKQIKNNFPNSTATLETHTK